MGSRWREISDSAGLPAWATRREVPDKRFFLRRSGAPTKMLKARVGTEPKAEL